MDQFNPTAMGKICIPSPAGAIAAISNVLPHIDNQLDSGGIMAIDKKVVTVHVTEEERVRYSVALIKESMKRQRRELAWTKEEIPRLHKRYKELEKNIKQLEKLIKSAPA